ncbi:MAG: lipopolysaccharide biosynthesis protein, partial [Muribaculaceae bacterium]|nr:lipopolysaccharide biosynthesis protein [Muribaculaceae bacterium]
LRYKKRPIKFAVIKLINIGLNIGLNLFFILLCPWLSEVAPSTIDWFYDPTYGIGYIFLSNFISSIATLLMLLPEVTSVPFRFNPRLWREMIVYSMPLLVLGIAGIMNQTIDKIIYPMLVTDTEQAMSELGIYGANYKIGIIMVMFIQAFRFAYEPFIFSQNKEKGNDSKTAYRDAMKYFIIFALFIFLGVMFYLDIVKYFISPQYFSGLKVVPIIMLAELFFGIFFNLSIWYKITDQTIWGAWFSIIGLAITLSINILFVPTHGYMACAWAAFVCYGVMMTISYLIGRAKYPIDYNIPRIIFYVVVAAILFVLSKIIEIPCQTLNLIYRTALLGIYIVIVCKRESLRPIDIMRRRLT